MSEAHAIRSSFKKQNFMDQGNLYSLGLDIDKKEFKACLKSKAVNSQSIVKATKTFNNGPAGFKELHLWITKHVDHLNHLRIIMEATGVYHEHLAWYLFELGYLLHIILPFRAHHYMQSLGIKSKNDKIDAQGLADMAIQQELEPWQPCSKELLKLRSLTRQYEMFQETKTSLSNQLEAALHLANCDTMVIRNLKSLIKKISDDINKLKSKIENIVLKDPVLSRKYSLIQSIKGFGIISFAVLVAETGGFELFENQKQLVSYAGYDIVENQSGKRVGKTKISKRGNTHMRRVLFMPAFNVVRYEVSTFYQLYSRVYERGKVKMKAYVAVQRKLLCTIYAIWKNDNPFNPDFQSKNNSGIHEPKPLFSADTQGPKKIVATDNAAATLDELPCNHSPEALFSVK